MELNNRKSIEMGRPSKILLILIGLLLVAFSFVSFRYYQELKEQNRQLQFFLNHFSTAVNKSLGSVEYLIKTKPTEGRLDEAIHSLEKDMLNADEILNSGGLFLDSQIYYSRFFLESTYYLYGLNMSGTVTANIPPFGEDGKLDERELTLLKTIAQYLEDAKEGLISTETNQVDPNLTMNDLNRINKNHINHSVFEIYTDAFR